MAGKPEVVYKLSIRNWHMIYEQERDLYRKEFESGTESWSAFWASGWSKQATSYELPFLLYNKYLNHIHIEK